MPRPGTLVAGDRQVHELTLDTVDVSRAAGTELRHETSQGIGGSG
jgi:hypothetical protein